MAGKKIHGGTTISGTMILSELAGIKIFGTGGLGKAHSQYQPKGIPDQVYRWRSPWR
jgi:pseudouridine-5'-phosphate glycosidase